MPQTPPSDTSTTTSAARTASSPAGTSVDGSRRWLMLLVVALGFVAFTFNWFVMPSTFGGVAGEFGAGVPQLALIISIFVAGYAIMHIPAGMIAVRFGLKPTMVAGLALQGLLTAAAALAPDYSTLLVLRLLAGLAASVFAGIGIAAISAWFRGREHGLALGVVSASFSIGVAVGLYAWGDVVAATGWRVGLGLAGGVTVAVAVLLAAAYRVPQGMDALAGAPLSLAELKAVVGSSTLWRYSLSFLVGYGGYFVVAQLIGTFALARGFDAGVAATAALMAGVAGLPGSLVAGWLCDRTGRRTACFVAFVLLQAVGTALIPFAGASWLWVAAFLVGFAYNGCFAAWQTVPAEVAGVAPEHIGTAVGLMLTIGGVGGFAVPWAFGLLVASAGYTPSWLLVAAGTALCLVVLAVGGRRARGLSGAA